MIRLYLLAAFLATPLPAQAEPVAPLPPSAAPACPTADGTIETLRAVLACERLRSAGIHERDAQALRDAQEKIAAIGEPPSRLQWLLTGAVTVGIGCVIVQDGGRQ